MCVSILVMKNDATAQPATVMFTNTAATKLDIDNWITIEEKKKSERGHKVVTVPRLHVNK